MRKILKVSGVIVISLIFSACIGIASSDGPVVKISQGKLVGSQLVSRAGREYSAFYEIPYATAERFEAPKLAGKWEGTYNGANRDRSDCAQTFWYTKGHSGEEDCMKLSVYTPDLKGRYPVMVYFHGGGFTIHGSQCYNGGYFVDEDVVLVTVNYRLGSLGFLSTGDEVIPGNNGLKDQSLALQWVQKNIHHFGGDAGSVTIFGNSAGGASVTYHILSNSSAGLFHGGIAQSGSALCSWAFSPKPREMAIKFGRAAGCATRNSKALLNCLKKKSLEEILSAQDSLVEWGYDPFTPFGPVVEPRGPNAFITEDPRISMTTGRFNKVPLITGIVENEGIMMHSAIILGKPELREDIRKNWREILPITLEYNQVYTNFTEKVLAELTEKIKNYYFQDKEIGIEETRQELTNLFSDRFFNFGVRETAVLLSQYTPVYVYMFAHNRGETSLTVLFDVPGNWGVAHADELSFFNQKYAGIYDEFEEGSPSEFVSKNVVKLWASFAKARKPTALWGSATSWNPVSPSEADGTEPLKYYRLDTDTLLLPEPFTDRIQLWKELIREATANSVTALPREEL